jgi:hypothetical protein
MTGCLLVLLVVLPVQVLEYRNLTASVASAIFLLFVLKLRYFYVNVLVLFLPVFTSFLCVYSSIPTSMYSAIFVCLVSIFVPLLNHRATCDCDSALYSCAHATMQDPCTASTLGVFLLHMFTAMCTKLQRNFAHVCSHCVPSCGNMCSCYFTIV